MQVLERVGHAEAGTKIEMKLSMADGRKIHQHHIAVSLLQRDSGIDGGGSGSGAALGTEESEDAGLAWAAAGARAVGTETC